jgi:hypothetical protein
MNGENKDVENNTGIVRKSSEPYIRCDTLGHTSGLETIRPLRGF